MRFRVRYTRPREFKNTLLFFGDGSALLTDTGLLLDGRLARIDIPFARRTELGSSGEATVRTIPYTTITSVRPLGARGGFEITYRPPSGPPREVLFQVVSGSEEFYQTLQSNRTAAGRPGGPEDHPRTTLDWRAAVVVITLVLMVGLFGVVVYAPPLDAIGVALIALLVLFVLALLCLFVVSSAVVSGAAARMGYSGILFFLLSILTSPYAGVFVLAGLPDRRIEAHRRDVLQWLRHRLAAGGATQGLAVRSPERSLGDMSTRQAPADAVRPMPAVRAPAPELSFPEPVPSRAIFGASIGSLVLPVLVWALTLWGFRRADEARSQEALRVIAGWQEKGDEDRRFELHSALMNLTKEDAIALARSSTTSPSMLRQLARHGMHNDEAALVLALCENPRLEGESCADGLEDFFRSERASQSDLDAVLRYVRDSDIPAETLEKLASRVQHKLMRNPVWQDGLADALCRRRDLPLEVRQKAGCKGRGP